MVWGHAHSFPPNRPPVLQVGSLWGSLGPQPWRPRAELGMRTLGPAHRKLWVAPPLSHKALGRPGRGRCYLPWGGTTESKAGPEGGGDRGPQVACWEGGSPRGRVPCEGQGPGAGQRPPPSLRPREALGPCGCGAWGWRGGGLGYGSLWLTHDLPLVCLTSSQWRGRVRPARRCLEAGKPHSARRCSRSRTTLVNHGPCQLWCRRPHGPEEAPPGHWARCSPPRLTLGWCGSFVFRFGVFFSFYFFYFYLGNFCLVLVFVNENRLPLHFSLPRVKQRNEYIEHRLLSRGLW